VTISDGRIGNGLADDGDRLVLRDGQGSVIDALSYGRDATVFQPPAPAVAAGHSLQRIQSDVDTDQASDFADTSDPSPGMPMPPATPTATPTVTPTPTASATPSATPTATATWPAVAIELSEFLPAPHDVDWDGDGQMNGNDEWIELHNRAAVTVDLGGWRLDDIASGGSSPYLIPTGSTIAGGGYRLFFHSETGLTLNNDGDTVRLLYPDGLPAEETSYGSALYDRSFSKTEFGTWTRDYPPSPGGPNLAPTPMPRGVPPTPAVVPISHARGAARDATVAVEGRVTVPPGVFGRRVAYITDGSAGLRLQHWGRDLPTLSEGDTVHVEGRMTTVYGEVTLNVREMVRMGAGNPVAPTALASGQAGAWWEGTLVRLAGRVQRWDSDDIILDDGSGAATVRLRESTGLQMPGLMVGQFLSAVGVVGQSNGRYLVLPRWQVDLSLLPAELPRTGER
jgi:hypothetical protein